MTSVHNIVKAKLVFFLKHKACFFVKFVDSKYQCSIGDHKDNALWLLMTLYEYPTVPISGVWDSTMGG